MPEIKNTFTQGKMNKDLDERIIPSGQYRHAMNVQVSTSEGSDIGTVQNILGNSRVENVVDVSGAKCIGSIADEKNDKLYWFITSDSIDAILEQSGDITNAVIIDTKANTSRAVLKFPNKIITGINIIDNLLIWTDGINEPRRINIERCKLGNQPLSSLNTAQHTKLIVNEEVITKEIIVESNHTSTTTSITNIELINTASLDIDDELIAIRDITYTAPFPTITAIDGNTITLSSGVLGSSSINPQDELVFKRTERIKEEHITAIKKNPLKPLSVIKTTEDDESKINPLFEKIFPRFSYRYRYEDGEYSTYAPFTDVVFESTWGSDPSGTQYDINDAYGIKEPYNNAMRNMLRSVKLNGFVSPMIPKDVVQIDLLYKREDSNVVYILEVLDRDSSEWSNVGDANSEYSGSFEVNTDNIYAAIPENQLLRPWDNIPKSAVAQEITGNRVVYGNYKQGYDLDEIPKIISDFTTRDIGAFDQGGLPSIKSQRDYQVGVIYGDKYGRETPVFTTEKASLNIPWGAPLPHSFNSQQLIADIETSHPSWANYYKFFVKETSGEYYNLVMDNIYSPTKEDLSKENHVWLSFSSSDRNKVSEEDYIILKKKVGSSDPLTTENKYKILDVQNEAPDAIKYKYLKLGEMSNANDELNNTTDGIFHDDTKRPMKNKRFIQIKKSAWHNPAGITNSNIEIPGMSLTINDETTDTHDLFISFYNDATDTIKKTDRFKISAIRISSGTVYELHLEKPLPDSFDDEYHKSGTSSHELDANTSVIIERKIVKNKEAFSGRFFVKIFGEGSPINELKEVVEQMTSWTTTSHQNIHWHSDTTTNTFDPEGGLINNGDHDITDLASGDRISDVITSYAGNLTDTPTEWDELLTEVGSNRFFIDNMYMAASQPSDTLYARHSGQGWYGGQPLPVGDIIYSPHSQWPHDQNWGAGGAATTQLPAGYTIAEWGQPNSTNAADGMAFPTNSDIKLNDPTTTTAGDNMVNGIPGIIDTSDDHNGSTGIRRWKESIHNNVKTQDYPTADGKLVIHLSFLAPGQDLHGGNWDNLGTGDATWRTLPRNFRGIWGGGVFTTEDGTELPQTQSGVTGKHHTNGVFCEAEETNVVHKDDWGGQPLHNVVDYYPTSNHFSDLVAGYDARFEDEHKNQWKPQYDSNGNFSSAIDSFVTKLKTPGQKFRFKDDPSGHVYEILKTVEKRIYNHTPWRRMYKWDDTNSELVATGASVEEAAIDWAKSRDDGSDTGGSSNKRAIFKQRVEDFAKPHNRRVCYIIHLKDASFPGVSGGTNPVDATLGANSLFNSLDSHALEFVNEDFSYLDGATSENPAIWETEPKDNVDLDIYYEAGQAYPTTLTFENKELFAPNGCIVSFPEDSRPFNGLDAFGHASVITEDVTMSWSGLDIVFSQGLNKYYSADGFGQSFEYTGLKIRFTREDGSYTTGIVTGFGGGEAGGSGDFIKSVVIEPTTETGLSWYNCFSFGNGIESDRIRDDFNAMTLTNGVRANATIEKPFTEEHRKNGLIYSGLYNSTSGINNLNQFIMAEKITKDLNPTYGSIQKLFSRRISLVAFCEDRVVQITANKNALYNADGNPQLVATNAVLGDANPFVGDYGISQNPESFAKDSYRAYFTDKQRGAVLRLSMDGLTPISDAGMHDYFRDNLKTSGSLVGTFDTYKNDYNLVLTDFLPENSLVNREVLGEAGNEEFFNDIEYVNNSNLSAGNNRVLPTAPINVAENSDLGSTTTITNHAEITQGSIQAFQAGISASDAIWSAPSNPSIFEADFDNADYGNISSTTPNPFWQGQSMGLDPFYLYSNNPSTVYVGETNNNNSEARMQGTTVGYAGIVGTAQFMFAASGKPSIRNTSTDGNTGTITRMWVKSEDFDSSIVDSDVSSSWPNANSMTAFHGEEYKATLKIQNYDTNGSDTVNLQITLYGDDGAPLDNAFLTDSNTVTTPSNSADHNQGFITNRQFTITNFAQGTEEIEFYFKIQGTEGTDASTDHIDETTDPNNHVLLNPVQDYINIHISHDDNDKNNRILLKYIQIEKVLKVTNPGNYPVAAVPDIPTSTISEWAEVENDSFNWTTTNGHITLTDVGETVYGASNPATSVPYTLADGVTTSSYLNGTSNGTTAYNDHADGPIAIDGNLQANGSAAFLTQDITSNPLVEDKWYEVKLTGVTHVSGTGLLVSNALDSNTFPSGYTTGDTLPGHLGTISAGDMSSITFSDQGSEWIARWQQKNDTNLNELKLYFYNWEGTIEGIEFSDISDKETGGTAAGWTLLYNPDLATSWADNIYHYYSPRKRIHYYNNRIRWGYDSNGDGFADVFGLESNYAVQSLTGRELPVTNDGYELRFQISLSPTGTNTGTGAMEYNSGGLKGYVTGPYGGHTNGHTYGFKFDGVTQGGYYRVRGNMDGTTTPTIDRTDSTYENISGTVAPITASIKDETGAGIGHANKVLFRPRSSGYKGTLAYVSLKDITNYFTSASINAWDFIGFDTTLENYIEFNSTDQNIVFNSAPNTVSLQQGIRDHNFVDGAIVQLKFDVSNVTQGSISGYFYNSQGKGFTFGPISSDGTWDSEQNTRLTIGDSTATTELLNTFVIKVDSAPFSGTLDNFELYRIYPDFTPTTVSYSEDVKGWVSFKSFVPESGVSLSKEYFTIKDGQLWQHHSNDIRNWFYGIHVDPDGTPDSGDEYLDPAPALSTITTILNAEPSLIKIYNTLNYEGSQSKVTKYKTENITDKDGNVIEILSNVDIYNLNDKEGWYVDSIITDKQSGSVNEFIEKEGKWFNYIKGTAITTSTSPSIGELSFQGLGMVSSTETI